MANHKSAIKRIRSNNSKREKNRLQHKKTKTAIKKLKSESKKAAAKKLLLKATSMLDKLAKNNILHKNKVNNLKSNLTKHVNSL